MSPSFDVAAASFSLLFTAAATYVYPCERVAFLLFGLLTSMSTSPGAEAFGVVAVMIVPVDETTIAGWLNYGTTTKL